MRCEGVRVYWGEGGRWYEVWGDGMRGEGVRCEGVRVCWGEGGRWCEDV